LTETQHRGAKKNKVCCQTTDELAGSLGGIKLLYLLVITSFLAVIWALLGLYEAHTGVNRLFRELELKREEAFDGEKANQAA
jgi:hypothetical protein